MASMSANLEENSQTRDKNKKKKNNHLQWKTGLQQRSYTCKLMEALRSVRRNTAAPSPSRVVREAAYRTLAMAAKGRTRWSRAILSNRRQSLKIRRKLRKNSGSSGSIRNRKRVYEISRRSEKRTPAVDSRLKVLGRLVPGCRKVSPPVLLEEVRDYIAALEMQVKAMNALTELLSSTERLARVPQSTPS